MTWQEEGVVPNAAEWKMHARQIQSLAECAERFGDAKLAGDLAAAARRIEQQVAVAEAVAARAPGSATIHRLPTALNRSLANKPHASPVEQRKVSR
jgi:hypothetical protein